MSLAARITGLAPSATMAVDAKAKALRAAGEPVIGFAAGEPDFPTPAHIVEAALRAAADPAMHRYTPAAGLAPLREAVAERARRDGLDVSADMVVITNGGKHALYNVFMALIGPGDEVLMPSPLLGQLPGADRPSPEAPAWPCSPTLLRASGSASTSSRPHERRARKRSSSCRPSNPTGAVYPPEEVAAIGRWAAEHGIWGRHRRDLPRARLRAGALQAHCQRWHPRPPRARSSSTGSRRPTR